jgi:chemotaxis protein MotB
MTDGTPIIIKKKKVHGGHAHHGGSWKVAYADFVTAMMAFFMVMWIMGLSQDTRAQIQGYFNDPLGFIKNEPKTSVNISPKGNPSTKQGAARRDGDDPIKAEQMKVVKMRKDLEAAMQKESDLQDLSKFVTITETPDGLLIEFVESKWKTFFQSGSAVIEPEAQKLFALLAPILAKSGRKMVVEGHTDAQPYPSATYTNWDLSSDRANAFRRALQAGGVTYQQILAVKPYAETRLRDPQHPLDASNRRVSLLLPKGDPTADLPRDALVAKPGPGPKGVFVLPDPVVRAH